MSYLEFQHLLFTFLENLEFGERSVSGRWEKLRPVVGGNILPLGIFLRGSNIFKSAIKRRPACRHSSSYIANWRPLAKRNGHVQYFCP
jgi:hypothetical protein